MGRVGLPEAASEQAPYIGNLWLGAWIASAVIGFGVLGLIIWSVVKYRRRSDNEVPRQTRYHVPLEVLYTLVPILIVGVLFYYTVIAQNGVLAQTAEKPLEVKVVAQKWSWTFNYMEEDNPEVGKVVHEVGTVDKIPDLVLPVNRTVRFDLVSADVIHSFWIPAFYFKMDVIPGHPNSFDVTPNKIGTFDGKCAELCGTYHAQMVFTVKVVSEADYEKYLKEQIAAGKTGEIKAPDAATHMPKRAPEEKP